MRSAAALRRSGRIRVWVCLLPLLVACGNGPEREATAGDSVDWALAIHGGAGVPEGSLDAAEQQAYTASLERALRTGAELLADGASSLDVVEQVVRSMEDDELFNAGKGAVFNADGVVELDASIMDGTSLFCGAVAGVRTVKNPVSLARQVMERTDHVLLSQQGAERFAESIGVETVDPQYFFTQKRWDSLQRRLQSRERGTVGAVALDKRGNLAAATSTGGLTGKLAGRVGDSPIIGAGTYADNTTCAVSATGKGEEFIRYAVAHSISLLMEAGGLSLPEAVDRTIHGKLQPGDGGVIAVDRRGRIVMEFNTPGMFRGAADAAGRFEVQIWK